MTWHLTQYLIKGKKYVLVDSLNFFLKCQLILYELSINREVFIWRLTLHFKLKKESQLNIFSKIIFDFIMRKKGFPGGLVVKNPSSMQQIQVQSLDQEGPLEKELATQFSILAWEIQLLEEPGELQSMGSQRVRHDLVTKQRTKQWQKWDRNNNKPLDGEVIDVKLNIHMTARWTLNLTT